MEELAYKYEAPEKEGWRLKRIRRSWFWNTYQYLRETPYNNRMESKHLNWLGKTLAIVLFPVSVVMAGAPEAWRDTYRHIWDRKYGAFVSHGWWTE
jgi:hypothetical protein